MSDQATAKVRFTSHLSPAADHLTLATNDEYGLGAAYLGARRVDRGARCITNVVDAREDSAPAKGIGEHAYWLSDLKPRSAKATATADARSEDFGVADEPVRDVASGTGTEGGARRPLRFASRERAWGPAPAAPKADRLVLDAKNLAPVTVDAKRARLSCAPQLAITSDGPVAVRITCATPRRCVSRRAFAARLPRQGTGERYVRSTVRVCDRAPRVDRARDAPCPSASRA